MSKYKIEKISNFYTCLEYLSDNTPIASLILPSSLRSAEYPNSFNVTLNTGKLIKLNTAYSYRFVPNSTAREITNTKFRFACDQNIKHLNTLTFDSSMLWSFEQALVDWLYYLPKEYVCTTLYGGDIINGAMLLSICEAFKRTPDKKSVIYTYNDEAVDAVRILDKVPSNLFLYKTNEWSYIVNDHIYFEFPNNQIKFLKVPVSSKNYKYLCNSSYII